MELIRCCSYCWVETSGLMVVVLGLFYGAFSSTDRLSIYKLSGGLLSSMEVCLFAIETVLIIYRAFFLAANALNTAKPRCIKLLSWVLLNGNIEIDLSMFLSLPLCEWLRPKIIFNLTYQIHIFILCAIQPFGIMGRFISRMNNAVTAFASCLFEPNSI